MNIHSTLLGSGNMAWHLSKAFMQNNIPFSEIIGRNKIPTIEIAERFQIKKCKHQLHQINSATDIVFLAISDDAIEEVANTLQKYINPKTIVVHCSGATSSKVLQKSTDNFGIFYPFLSLSKQTEIDYGNMPICILGVNKKVETFLLELATIISDDVHILNDKQRAQLHLAAVFANNFTNHLIKIAFDLLEKESIDTQLLLPLLQQGIKKIHDIHPWVAQTGPAIRNDQQTILKHLNMLENESTFKEIYKLISQSIQSQYKHSETK